MKIATLGAQYGRIRALPIASSSLDAGGGAGGRIAEREGERWRGREKCDASLKCVRRERGRAGGRKSERASPS
eukprot:3401031-Rhodomonas_salina.3